MSNGSSQLASRSSAPPIAGEGGGAGFLPYEEPAIRTLLVLASFILLLNAVNTILDRLLYCGLVGQILIGVAWGTPGGNWLSIDAQKTIVQLGYLGLILLVYEGGLATSLSSVKQNAWLSACVAAIGIGLPISLSFVLMPLLNASPLQAFAAGAALCSTSLGTTFTVLSTCGLVTTRLGTILSTAAMMDDVIGLIMVQIVSNLGQGAGGDLDAGIVLRPIGVSIAIVLLLVTVCRFVILPCSTRIVPTVRIVLSLPYAPVVMQSLFLLGIFTGSSFAGTSGLFAAYLAGAMLSWWDRTFQPGIIEYLHGGGGGSISKGSDAETGTAVYSSSYASVTNLLMKPLFFASIGFSVPISRLFGARVVWRGLVYTVLMLFAKLATGICLLRRSKHEACSRAASPTDAADDSAGSHEETQIMINDVTGPRANPSTITGRGGSVAAGTAAEAEAEAAQTSGSPATREWSTRLADNIQTQSRSGSGVSKIASPEKPSTPLSPGRNLGTPDHVRATATIPSAATTLDANDPNNATSSCPKTIGGSDGQQEPPELAASEPNAPSTITKPAHSSPSPSPLYPSLLLGLAMTARGEIGYLIASVAQSSGIFSSTGGEGEGGNDDIFIVIIWAVTLCTVIGPLSVGLLVRRIRRIGGEGKAGGRAESSGGSDGRKVSEGDGDGQKGEAGWAGVLGKWGASVE